MTRLGHTHNDGYVRARPAGRTRGAVKSSGQFSIPAFMYRQIPDNAQFVAEWHELGILYRFIGVNDAPEPGPPPPEWTAA